VSTTPKISVSVICYNQERYIADCLDSILAQRIELPFEIVVGDDASKDNTQTILMDYQQRHPDTIRVIFHEKNVGATANHNDVTVECKGEYVAHIDGDDRMLPGKLARQAAFLDAHPECSMVVHKVNVIRAGDGRYLGEIPHKPQPAVSDINYLVKNYQFFVASSKMYRRSANIFPRRSVPTVDLLLHIEHASVGNIGYLDETLGEYRKVRNSMSDVRSSAFSASVQGSLDSFDRALELGVPSGVVDEGRSKFKAGVALYYLEVGNRELFAQFINDSVVEGKYVGIHHRVLHALGKSPGAARLLYRAYKPVRAILSRRM